MVATAVELAGLTIITTVQVVGLFLNSCIVFFNFIRMNNERIINASTLIYFAMGLLNVFMQLQLMIHNFFSVFWPHVFFTREVGLSLHVLSLFVMHCNFWLTGWLCAYYCITIVSTGHRLIVVLRRSLSSFLPRILLLTAAGSVVISVPSICMMDMVLRMQPQSNSTLKSSFKEVIFFINPIYAVMTAVLGSCLPFILAAVSTAVTTFALIRHITNMKRNVSGCNQPNIQTLINATRTMILFLTCSIIFCSFELVYLYKREKSTSDFITMTGWIVVMCFPLAEALIIVQAIPKLRKTILEKLCFMTSKQ